MTKDSQTEKTMTEAKAIYVWERGTATKALEVEKEAYERNLPYELREPATTLAELFQMPITVTVQHTYVIKPQAQE